MAEAFPEAELVRLAELETPAALAELDQSAQMTASTAAALAAAALAHAENKPDDAAAWLTLASAVNAAAGDDPAAAAHIEYARARQALVRGDLESAADSLQRARLGWEALGDRLNWARTSLGTTQVLAMQGRLTEAEETIQGAISLLAAAGADGSELLLTARQNLATLLTYQEHHAEALAVNEQVKAALAAAPPPTDDENLARQQARVGRLDMAMALSLAYLDRPQEAEDLLRQAVALLQAAGDAVDCGRAQTNLGHLLARTGRFAAALEEFDRARGNILGSVDADAARARWPLADVLFLEQAVAYLALNLLPEARAQLDRAMAVFAATGQPYEMGQALYYDALLAWRQGEPARAAASLAAAAQRFQSLDNVYWLNWVRLASAGLALRLGRPADAAVELGNLAAEAQIPTGAAVHWDTPLLAELQLLRLQLALQAGDYRQAEDAAAAASSILGMVSPADTEPAAFAHLQVRLLHAMGQLERAQGNPAAARTILLSAVDRLEGQRITLPLEDLRTSFLADKTALYSDLVLSLLETPAPSADAVAAAFAVVERARSRTLLERLLTTIDERAASGQGLEPRVSDQMADLRRQLHWLYNQFPGEGGGSRRAAPAISAQIRRCEEALRQLEWRAADWLQQAEPVALADLQQFLDEDEQAVAYYFAGQEVIAFAATRRQAEVVRRLTTTDALEAALAELRFQLGRVEIGDAYAQRHAQRLAGGVSAALARLYTLLIAPLKQHLHAPRLLVIPFGPLHTAPFHAFLDGTTALVEQFEVCYAPSASIAVYVRRPGLAPPLRSLAAVALADAAIPHAAGEAQAAASVFSTARVYLDQDAVLANLKRAAAECDVLHVATHGLFRPDNPFFSALKLADGWIDVRQIYRLRLRARLVVLSACESGAAYIQGSDEAIGLARGFLGAGARSLVVSLWNVHDASAAGLMADFYRALAAGAGQRPAAALAAIQQEAARAGRHPYFWAPYIAIG